MAHDQPNVDSDQQKKRLQDLFDMTLYDTCYITKVDFDLAHSKLTILFNAYVGADETLEHRVVFSGVRALLYQHELHWPFEPTPDDFIPPRGVLWAWAGYNYYDRPVIVRVIDPPHGLEPVDGVSMNFALDLSLSDGVMLIAARGVSIDDKSFDVGLPPTSQAP